MSNHARAICVTRAIRASKSWLLAALAAFCAMTLGASARFDVFLGFDQIVPDASWFPIVCEVQNDGPSYTATIEVAAGGNQDQSRRMVVELPTGTLKRVVIPVFASGHGFNYGEWNVRLLDERGRKREERTGLQAVRHLQTDVPLIGSLPRTSKGKPVIREVVRSDQQPASARFLTQLFPDNPLVLERMDCLYLSSETAQDLSDAQVHALYCWLNAGGHLIIGVEQVSEVNAKPWLKNLFPCDLKDMSPVASHAELEDWLRRTTGMVHRRGQPSTEASPFRDLPADSKFAATPLEAAVGDVRSDGRVEVSAGDRPLIVTANHERGRVTALLFSPEREPFASWKNLPTFWAKITEVPAEFYAQNVNTFGQNLSTDGVFGAMLDTHQIHKLPVTWLLLLLVVYLVVIGPLDQYWLKRIGKPMLTWITFPGYVVLFSLIIYFIGYKLRAGDSEWNELNVVDVYPGAGRAELRGRTYATVYSPSNQRYLLEARQRFATLRGEAAGYSGEATESLAVEQKSDNCKAGIFVPVWTSQLYASDWWQAADMPLTLALVPQGDGWQVTVENRTESKLTYTELAVGNYLFQLGEVPANGTKTFQVWKNKGMMLANFVSTHGGSFQMATQRRRQVFGSTEQAHLDDKTNSTVAVSFLSYLGRQQNYQAYQTFYALPGLDLSPLVEHDQAVLFAWAEGFSPVEPLNQFSPRRIHRDTMWRVSAPVP